eukprot:2547181-Amphidinium_carterae.2
MPSFQEVVESHRPTSGGITSALHRMRVEGLINSADGALVQNYREEMALEGQPWAYQLQALNKVLVFNGMQLEDCVQSLKLKSYGFKTLRLKIA